MRKVFRVDCRFLAKGTVPVADQGSAIHLYRIAQEAVSNAIRHGKARRIRIQLGTEDGRVGLTVRDDGIGIPRKLPRQKGMGLPIMQYRAEVMGGSLAVQRKPGGGTTVVCAVPQGAATLGKESRR